MISLYVDSHIHLTHSLFEGKVPCIVSEEQKERIVSMDRKKIIEECRNNGIVFCIEPGIDFESNYKFLQVFHIREQNVHYLYQKNLKSFYKLPFITPYLLYNE